MEFIIMCCNADKQEISDVSKIILAQIISFIIALFLFYINKEKDKEIDKERKIENTKTEIISVCEKIAIYQIMFYTNSVNYLYHNKISHPNIDPNQLNLDKNLASIHAQEFYSEHIKASTQLSLNKTELLKFISTLCIYIPHMKSKLIPLLLAIRTAKDLKNETYEDLTSFVEIKARFEEINKNINDVALTNIGNILGKIKYFMNPDFFSATI